MSKAKDKLPPEGTRWRSTWRLGDYWIVLRGELVFWNSLNKRWEPSLFTPDGLDVFHAPRIPPKRGNAKRRKGK
jgi:hypothetical protein